MAGKKGRSGPRKGLPQKNGTAIARLTLGELPRQLTRVKVEGRVYRRAIEAAVLDAHGQVTRTASHYIDTAAAATVFAGTCRWLLRNRLETMSTSDILACSKEILKAKQARDAAIRELDIDKAPEPMELKDIIAQPSITTAHGSTRLIRNGNGNGGPK